MNCDKLKDVLVKVGLKTSNTKVSIVRSLVRKHFGKYSELDQFILAMRMLNIISEKA